MLELLQAEGRRLVLHAVGVVGTEHDLFGARKMDFVNPVRASVWKDEEFRDRIAKSYPGYLEQFDASAPGAKIYFTPQPLFFDLTTEWAATLQKMVAKEVPVDEGLDQLADSINRAAEAGRPRLSSRTVPVPRVPCRLSARDQPLRAGGKPRTLGPSSP